MKPLGTLAMVLCLLCAARAHAQALGRLFTTPGDRAVLERTRHARVAPASAAPRPALAPIPTQAAVQGTAAQGDSALVERRRQAVEGGRIIVVNGTVRRSGSGRVTSWIDSVPRTGNERLPGGAALAQDRRAGKVALTLRSGKSVTLKPGQAVDAASGQVTDAYQPLVKRSPDPARQAR